MPAIRVEDDTRDSLQCVAATQPGIDDRIRLLESSALVGAEVNFIGFPAAGPREKELCAALVAHVREQRLAVEPVLMARADPGDVAAVAEVRDLAAAEVTLDLYISTSALRMAVEGWTSDAAFGRLRSAADLARREGLRLRIAFEDSTRTDPGRLREAIDMALDCGAREIVLNDTVGACLPDGAERHTAYARAAIEDAGAEQVSLAWHGHDDKGLALANAMAAARGGATLLSGTFLGIGERAGNVPLEQVIALLVEAGAGEYRLELLADACRLTAGLLGVPLAGDAPLVGRDVFTTGTGTHAAALLKARQLGPDYEVAVYSGVDSSSLGRSQRILVGPHSGRAAATAALESAALDPADGLVETLLDHCRRGGECLVDADQVRRAVGLAMSTTREVDAAVYRELEDLLNGVTASEAGFAERLCASPWPMPANRPDPAATHAAIRDFQLTLARLWLGGEWPRSHRAPVWGAPVPSDAFDGCDPEWLVPCFVRTDESLAGEIYELQCAGGWWGTAQALDEVLRPGGGQHLAGLVAEEIEWLFPEGARVLHLFESAGLPHDSHFFARRVRAEGSGIQYRGIDAGVFPGDCNFIRAHSYGSVVAEDLFRLRLRELPERSVRFDHPPLPVFDQKLPLALPFDPETAHRFTDAHRDLFPYTALIKNGEVVLADGEETSLEELVRRPPERRRYYLKYAGMDASRNYGARAVYDLSRVAPETLRALPGIVEADGEEPWILQQDRRSSGSVSWVDRRGDIFEEEMTLRMSSFLGPRRRLGSLFLAQASSAVRGGAETALAIVEDPAAPDNAVTPGR